MVESWVAMRLWGGGGELDGFGKEKGARRKNKWWLGFSGQGAWMLWYHVEDEWDWKIIVRYSFYFEVYIYIYIYTYKEYES